VQPGDTLSAIAARQGVSLKALEAANPQIRDFNHIYPGQVIHLPGSSGSSAAGGNYTVRSGDTMSGIAARHGVSLAALLAANPQIGNPNRIYPGQVIHLPGGSGGGRSQAPASHDYTVRPGDTMSGIAARFGVSLAALERANPQIANPNRIYAGQVVHIPGAGGTKGTGGVQGTSGSSGVGGGKVVDIARQFLGRNASELKRSGALPMNPNVPSDVCCANFVSAVLQKAGLLDRHTDLVSGSSRTGPGAAGSIGRILKDRGWKVVDAAHAKPGDVCILNNGNHVELVASNDHGNIQLIGSNNTNRDGTQRVGYGHPYGGAWYLTPP
jgi:LysM repeat protein